MKTRSFSLMFFLLFFINQIFSQGVTIVKDLSTGNSSTFSSNEPGGIITAINDNVYFYSDKNTPGTMWVTDVNTLETTIVTQKQYMGEFTKFDNKLFFRGYSEEEDIFSLIVVNEDGIAEEIWTTDNLIKHFTVFEEGLYFKDGVKLMKYSATNGVEEIYAFDSFGGILDITATENNLFIIGGTSGYRQLFLSDGTTAGTNPYFIINDGSEFNSGTTYMTAVDDKVFFWFEKNGDTYRLWVTDGTEAGTIPLTVHKKILFEDMKKDGSILSFDGKLYYRGDSNEDGDFLYVSDGTVAGSSVYFNDEGERPKDLFVYNNSLYFRGNIYVAYWYKTNGDPNDVEAILEGYRFRKSNMAKYGDKLVFPGYNGDSDNEEIFLTDGSLENTTELTDISMDGHSFEPYDLTVAGDKIFFIGSSLEFGKEVFVYDPNLGNEPKIEISNQPVSIDACEGISTMFSIEASGENNTYQWMKDGNEVLDGENSILEISNVKIEDSGVYNCTVLNNSDTIISDNAILTVTPLINISTQPVSTESIVGDNVILSVDASGTIGTYQWFKDDSALEDGEVISGAQSYKLTLTNITQEDQGVYYVHLSGECNDLNSENTTLSIITGITTEKRLDIRISPNPVVDEFRIINNNNSKIDRVVILNTTGKVVFEEENTDNIINVSKLSKGIYFIKVISGAQFKVFKFIIME